MPAKEAATTFTRISHVFELNYKMSELGNFAIKGSDGSIVVSILEVYGFPNETCHWGGYDTKSAIEIKAANYRISGQLYIATGEIFNFYKQLKDCQRTLKGKATLTSYEGNLSVEFNFDEQGHVQINGNFQEYQHSENELIFELDSDQSYFNETIVQLDAIVKRYGGMTGVKGL